MPEDIAELIGMTEAEQQATAREHKDLQRGRPLVERPQAQQDDIGLSDRYAGQPEPQDDTPAEQVPPVPQPLHDPSEQRQTVPRQALQRERETRQERDRELDAMRAELAQTRERFAMLNETVKGALQPAQQPMPAAQDQMPNPEEDLLGYVRAVEQRAQRQVDERLRPIEERDRQRQQTDELGETIKAVKAVAANDRARFEAENPDFGQAYAWMRNAKYQGMLAAGADPQRAAEYLDNEEYNLVALNNRNGRNSAEAFYNAARAMGYQPQAPQPQPAPQNGNGQAWQQQTMRQPAPAQLPPGQPTMANIRSGMMEGSSIGQAAQTGSGQNALDLEQLVDLPDAEFYRRLGDVKRAMARLR